VVTDFGYDPVWFGLLFLINIEMGLLTPPFGLNLFVMRAVAPPDTATRDIYLSVVPFLLADALVMVLIMAFPVIGLGVLGLIRPY
jgi:TRAP-type mannitol/chloroaromatic compound transport system permease large subunit